jgi:DNA-binding XRE family transcriptional regulator
MALSVIIETSCPHTTHTWGVWFFVSFNDTIEDEMVSDDKTLAQQFGNRVRALRKKQGMTQEQLAEATGLSVNFVSFVERGLRSPSLANIGRIARALNVPVMELFNFET